MKTLFLLVLALYCTFYLVEWHGSSGIDYTDRGDNWDGQCSIGHLQSPIDIQTSDVFTSSSYKAYGKLNDLKNATLQYDHHKLLVNYDQGSFTFIDDDGISEWRSLQFHFHAASEHHIDGYEYDAELHIVFVNKNDPHRLLVTGFFIQGDPNAEPSEFLENLKLNNLKEGDHTRDVKLDDLYNKIIIIIFKWILLQIDLYFWSFVNILIKFILESYNLNCFYLFLINVKWIFTL